MMALKSTYMLSNPETRLYVDDCLELLPRMLRGQADLVFADPPFNIGQDYTGYNDSQEGQQYIRFTRSWVACCERILAPAGSLWINAPDVLLFSVEAAARLCGLARHCHCIWHYRFGQCTDGRFIPSHTHALWFVRKGEKPTWNPDAVLVESDRATKYADVRTQKTQRPGKRVPLDVWGIPSDGPYWGRVQGNNAERRGSHPNQLPERYLERVILACSNAGDLILDPFLGSGTTGVVARALGRRFVGVEISESSVQSAYQRMIAGAVRVGGPR